MSDLSGLRVQQFEQGTGHTVDLVRHTGQSLSGQALGLFNGIYLILCLEVVVLAVLCHFEEVAVVVPQLFPCGWCRL